MIGSPVRRLVLPLLSVVLVVVALPRVASPDGPDSTDPPATAATAPLVDDPLSGAATAEQAQALLDLWDSWGPDVMSTDGPDAPAVPAELAALSFEEKVYVLSSVRAAQLAAAQGDAGPGEDQAAASARSGLDPEPPAVTAAGVGDGGGCTSLTWSYEPYGRTFYGLAAASDEPGPEPTSALEGDLLQSVRVGLDDLDDATCGAGGVAFSPAAQRALQVLSPELLEH